MCFKEPAGEIAGKPQFLVNQRAATIAPREQARACEAGGRKYGDAH
jgi:hypothetical protein